MSRPNDSNTEWKDWLKHILDEVKGVREDQKEITDEQKAMSKVLTQNTISLEEHIRRTELLEEVVKEIKEDRKKSVEVYENRFRPLEKQSLFIVAYWKLALLMITIITSEAFIAAWKVIGEFIAHVK
jgi:hypothetical protein